MLYANHWEYWQLYQKVTFDGVAKTIAVNPNVTTLNIRSDVYSAWVDWLVVMDNAKYLPAIRSAGYDPIPGGFTGDVYFLFNGWKLLVDLTKVAVTGVLYSDNYPTAYYGYDLRPQYPAVVSSLVSASISTQNVVTGTALTSEETANAVWNALVRTLTASIDPTAAAIAAAVWEEPVISHSTVGTYGSDLATVSDIQASAATAITTYTSGSIIAGNLLSGAISNTIVRDNAYWIIGEATTGNIGLTVEYVFNLPSIKHRAGVFSLFGRYDGKGSSHYLNLWVWNVEVSAWELLHSPFITNSAADQEFTHAYSEHNIDRSNNNEVKFRIIHNVTSYSSNHELAIDACSVTSIDVITAADIATAVLSAAQTTPIHSDMRKTVGTNLHGDGSELNKFRSSLIP